MKTQCPNCKARFNTNEMSIGKQAKCPKCAKPFTIQPFAETPTAAAPPATSPKPVETPVQKTEPVSPPAKSEVPVAPPAQKAEPAEPPAKSAQPVKSPEPKAQPVKSAEPIAPATKSPEPAEPPIKKLTAEHAETAEEKPKTIFANSAVSAVESVSKTALSKAVFVYCWMAVRIIAGVLSGLGLMLAIRKETHSTVIMTFAAADVFLVCSVAIELSLFYKMWAAIGDNQVSITPGKAVALLFIPVFNIYWALCMLTGFAEDYNSFIHRRSIKAKDLSFVLFLVYAFVFILAALAVTIPMVCVFAFIKYINRAFVGYTEFTWALLFIALAAGVIHFIMYILFATKTCNAVNALSE
ncbi:MAG: MJ0042-type zinc finger domain-containing protein [Planctomycetota bacterium]